MSINLVHRKSYLDAAAKKRTDKSFPNVLVQDALGASLLDLKQEPKKRLNINASVRSSIFLYKALHAGNKVDTENLTRAISPIGGHMLLAASKRSSKTLQVPIMSAKQRSSIIRKMNKHVVNESDPALVTTISRSKSSGNGLGVVSDESRSSIVKVPKSARSLFPQVDHPTAADWITVPTVSIGQIDRRQTRLRPSLLWNAGTKSGNKGDRSNSKSSLVYDFYVRSDNEDEVENETR